ncbi:hypothetical protein L1049_028428 [Liquidambar formosana]|uniref:Protein NBR1 homolog n=1 Tax=Liquidambar formosana TaxID=63359 RepID=A0AAP0RIV5_LIQFO
MESNVVIKVKYGDTLRRFNARVDENEQMELDMCALRAKILSLFNIAPDADITLTYIDVDDDVVTLVDDGDLHDVMRQCLNPLRINVVLNNDKGGRSHTRSSGSSTPMRSPRVQLPLPDNINIGVAEILKSAPEPIREALSKLSHDWASKAATSAPLFSEIVDCLSKMGQSYLNPGSQFQVGAESNTQNEASQSPMDPSVAEEPKSSKVDGTPEVFPTNLKVDIGNVSRGVATQVTPAPASVDLNLERPADSVPSGSATVNVAPVASNVPAGDNRKEKETEKGGEGHHSGVSVGAGASKSSGPPMKHYYPGPSQTDGFRWCWNSSTSNFGLNPFNECPFMGMPVADDSAVNPVSYPRIHPFKRSYNHCDGMGGMFHRGVRCDGCGVHPITGPRFKSKVKEDYDLCSICFAEMGNVADYIRLDRPVPYRHPLSFKGLHEPLRNPLPRPPAVLRHALRECGIKSGRPKLDSRFILDVNVLDGTMMAPSTPFTKIWRMRNNGSFVWPRGAQLVWIGGDRFSDAVSVELEIPADGVPMDKELDIAVDFIAPDRPGRYTSYWRMASPSGQKFGQRVWVLIQVDASLKDALCDSFHGLNLNLPPESTGSKSHEIIDVNIKPTADGSLPEPSNYTVARPVMPMVDEQPNKDQELNFPINDTLLVGNGVSNPVPPAVPTSVSYPGVSNPVPPMVPPSVSYLVPPVVPPSVSYPGVSNPIPSVVPASVSYPSVSNPIPSVVPASVSYPGVSNPIPSVVPASVSYPGVSNPIPSVVPASGSYPIIDFSDVALPTLFKEQYPAVDVPAASEEVNGNNNVEQTLLKELAEMGFKQVDLNKEILRMNEYDLEQSVDDLCGVAEWDPILEELQEMGFCDDETNRRLLKKNNGSIKRVVMDLIAGEKP